MANRITTGNVYKSLLWGGLLIVALGLRLGALDLVPLSPDEARIALLSLDVVRGEGWPASTDTPLLLMGNALLFLLLGPTEVTARLLPALAGVGLVAVPWLWRRRLGESGALVAAALLTLSPIALFDARRLDAGIIAVLGAALVITALATRSPHPHLLLGPGLALGLTGGPLFYDVLLPGLLAWALARHLLSETAPLGRKALLRGLLLGVGGALLTATGFGLRWSGWSEPASGLAAWVQSWWSGDDAVGLGPLLLYEPLTLLLVGVSLYFDARRADGTLLLPGLWAVVSALLIWLRAASPLAALVPLALLAGRGAAHLLSALKKAWTTGLHLFLTFLFWGFAGLVLIRQTSYLQQGLEFFLASLVVLVQVLLIMGFASATHLTTACRSFWIGTALILLLLQVSFAWRLNYNEATAPYEPLTTTLASRDLYNLPATVESLRRVAHVSPENFELVLVAGEPGVTAAVRWALRAWPALRVTSTWPVEPPHLVVSPENVTPSAGAVETFRGMAFTATRRAESLVPACSSLMPPICAGPIDWYVFRQSPAPVERTCLILWAPAPFADAP
ncbi:MAG: hypothetical protein ACP5HM_03590 [Anaerolineae bacterium]